MPGLPLAVRRAAAILGPFALFLCLAAGFLWRPLATGGVLLPADIPLRYDHAWKAGRDPSRIQVENPLLGDVVDYYYPYRVHALGELGRGHVPLWNPWILAGTPFFASAQAALLDPVNVLTLPSGPLASWTHGALLRIALLGWFTFCFARGLVRSALAAAAAGIVFMFSGVVAVWLNYPVVTSLTWMPALFWAGSRLVETGCRRHLAATGLAIGALLLGGHPETQFLVGFAWVAYCVHALAARPWAVAVRRAGCLGAAIALGLAIGAVQWLPFVHFLWASHAFTARVEPHTSFDLLETLLRLAVLLLPNLGGTRMDMDYWLPQAQYLNFNERTGYVGLLALGLAILGFVTARRAGGQEASRTWFFGLGAVFAILLAIRAPGFHLARQLPLLEVGHGVRWMILSSFFVALLAASGIDALLRARPAERLLRRSALVFAAVVGAGGVALVGAWAILAHGFDDRQVLAIRSLGEVTLVRVGVLAELLDPVRFTVFPPLLFLLAGSVLLFVRFRGVIGARVGALGLCALLYLDLWSFGSRYNPVSPAEEVFPETASVRFLRERAGRERFVGAGDLLRPNVAMLFGLRDLRGYEDLVDQSFHRLYGETLAHLREGAWLGDPSLSREEGRLLQLASVRFLLSHVPLRCPPSLGCRRVSVTPGVLIYEIDGFLPRAYTVPRARVVVDLEGAREALLDPDFDPLREVVLVGARAGPAGTGHAAGSVAWRVDEPEDVALEVRRPSAGYLVLTDLHATEWVATVDGEPAALLRANGVFRAVPVPAGTHEVRLRYVPRLVYASAASSAAAGAAGLLLLALTGVRASRRADGESDPSQRG